MKRKRIIVTSLLLLTLCSVSSLKAAELKYSRFMTWKGERILGKESTGNFKPGDNTRIVISNNVTKAYGTPKSWNAKLSLRKKGALTYKSIYEMTQKDVANKTWTYTIDKAGTYDMYFESIPVNGTTNPLDMNGMIETNL